MLYLALNTFRKVKLTKCWHELECETNSHFNITKYQDGFKINLLQNLDVFKN